MEIRARASSQIRSEAASNLCHVELSSTDSCRRGSRFCERDPEESAAAAMGVATLPRTQSERASGQPTLHTAADPIRSPYRPWQPPTTRNHPCCTTLLPLRAGSTDTTLRCSRPPPRRSSCPARAKDRAASRRLVPAKGRSNLPQGIPPPHFAPSHLPTWHSIGFRSIGAHPLPSALPHPQSNPHPLATHLHPSIATFPAHLSHHPLPQEL